MTNAKRCRVCGEEKPLEDFHPRKDAKDGRRNDCRECNLRQQSLQYRATREERAEYRKQRYVANREAVIQDRRDFRARERERINERRRELRAANPEKYRETQRAFYQRHTEKVKERVRTRHFRRRWVNLDALAERDGLVCGFCGGALTLAGADVDHIVPRALGGTNDFDNLRLAHPYCNRSMGPSVGRQSAARYRPADPA